MSLFQESSQLPTGRAVLLSIKPRYAELILAREKTIELRRSWPASGIGVMVLYSSAPIQRIVGLALVDSVRETSLEELWHLSSKFGGGVTRDELYEYFAGKKLAYGVMIKSVEKAEMEVDPKDLFPKFVPPQSFSYLRPAEYKRVLAAMFPKRES
jgi:predicted transcriptional regulator